MKGSIIKRWRERGGCKEEYGEGGIVTRSRERRGGGVVKRRRERGMDRGGGRTGRQSREAETGGNNWKK